MRTNNKIFEKSFRATFLNVQLILSARLQQLPGCEWICVYCNKCRTALPWIKQFYELHHANGQKRVCVSLKQMTRHNQLNMKMAEFVQRSNIAYRFQLRHVIFNRSKFAVCDCEAPRSTDMYVLIVTAYSDWFNCIHTWSPWLRILRYTIHIGGTNHRWKLCFMFDASEQAKLVLRFNHVFRATFCFVFKCFVIFRKPAPPNTRWEYKEIFLILTVNLLLSRVNGSVLLPVFSFQCCQNRKTDRRSWL